MPLQLMIPLDGSEFSEQAIPYALELAAQVHATVHLVKVHVPLDESRVGDAMYTSAESVEECLRDDDRYYLARIMNYPRLAALKPITALLDGPVVPALEKYVDSCGIELIVMSTHGRGGLTRAWVGSVADSLVRETNVPVLLLRPHGHALRSGTVPVTHNILLPVDGSEFSERLIEAAVYIGGVSDTHYTLLQVLLPPPPVMLPEGLMAPMEMVPAWEEARQEALAHLELLAGGLRARGASAHAIVLIDTDVAKAIRSYALGHDVDLIAMVTHGRSGWERMVMGSVSDSVMRGTSVPLLVMHPEPARVAERI